MHKRAKKGGLDLDQYNTLKREIAEIESDLRRLRDPLQMHLPLIPSKNSCTNDNNSEYDKLVRKTNINLKSNFDEILKNVNKLKK